MSIRNPQINIRVPPELKDSLHEAAMKNGNSVNAEIVSRLENSILDEVPINKPISANDALKRSKTATASSKATLIDRISEDINDASGVGEKDCKVLLPGSFYDHRDEINTESESYKNIIAPVISDFIKLGYSITLDTDAFLLDVSWNK